MIVHRNAAQLTNHPQRHNSLLAKPDNSDNGRQTKVPSAGILQTHHYSVKVSLKCDLRFYAGQGWAGNKSQI